MKKCIKIISFLLLGCILITSFAACGAKTMMTLDDKKMSVNVYEFLLSRMKGTLKYYGYDVDNESFWNTIVAADGTTYNDYFCATIRQETARYLISEYLFEKEGLKFDDKCQAEIDKLMDAYEKNAGSQTKLNATLKEFGVNYELLREIYVLEEKIKMLKDHLYGENGEKIKEDVKDGHLNNNYVSFKQIFLATYSYVIDKDRFGDNVYYTDEEHNAIAYDKKNGATRTDEYGKVIKDVLGNPEYYNADGKIAYDKNNGVLGYVTDENDDKVIQKYSAEKKGEIFANAQKLAEDCAEDVSKFDELAELYSEIENSRIYLYASAGYYAAQNDSVAYFDDIAEMLLEMDVGECRIFESEYGCHVILKQENENKAYELEENKDAFASFYDDLISSEFKKLCAQYESQVKVDEEIARGAVDMIGVGANTLY